MKNPCENPYKLARMIAGLNQEDAAFLLHISTRTLSEYERGAVRPHDDIVEKMIEVYNVLSLRVWKRHFSDCKRS